MTKSDRPVVQRVQPPKAPYNVVNAVMRWMLSTPRSARSMGGSLLLLHLTGRKSGREFEFPVAYVADGDRLVVLTTSMWRVNLRERPDVQVTLRGRRVGARAELVEDPDAVARVYGARIAEVGYAKAGRRMGIRINVDRPPTHEELVDAVRRDGLSVVYLTVAVDAP
ncbi:MAG: nitroreductase/quinone reductase family protein [Cellulomonas sp.]